MNTEHTLTLIQRGRPAIRALMLADLCPPRLLALPASCLRRAICVKTDQRPALREGCAAYQLWAEPPVVIVHRDGGSMEIPSWGKRSVGAKNLDTLLGISYKENQTQIVCNLVCKRQGRPLSKGQCL